MLLNCGVGEDSWESLGLQGDPTSLLKDQSWIFIGRTYVEAETPILWPPDVKSWLIRKDWCWERLRAGREGDDRGWDCWMASLTQWTWVWVDSRSWWWTGKPGMLWFMGLQRVGHNWVTELNLTSIVVYVGVYAKVILHDFISLQLRQATITYFNLYLKVLFKQQVARPGLFLQARSQNK